MKKQQLSFAFCFIAAFILAVVVEMVFAWMRGVPPMWHNIQFLTAMGLIAELWHRASVADVS